MSLIRKHGAVLQAWACLALVFIMHMYPHYSNANVSVLMQRHLWLSATTYPDRHYYSQYTKPV